jgi:hypothetical protein
MLPMITFITRFTMAQLGMPMQLIGWMKPRMEYPLLAA